MRNYFFSRSLCNSVPDEKRLNIQGTELLSLKQANELKHGYLFDTVASRQGTWTAYDSLPLLNQNVMHIAIPYSYDQHHEVIFGKRNLEEEITSFINRWMGGVKYLLSCDSEFFFALKLDRFDYDQVDAAVEASGFNSHFVLFDEKRLRWVIFYGRFPFITVSWKLDADKPMIAGKAEKFWQKYFADNAPKAFREQKPEFVEFINKTYVPRLVGYSEVLAT